MRATRAHKDGDGYEETILKLSQFGLSFDEASIFHLLTRANKSGALWISGKDLAKIANRDRTRVYQMLQRLVKIGLVRTDFSRPVKFSAVPPDAAVKTLVSIHEAKLVQLTKFQSDVTEALKRAEPIAPDLRSESRAVAGEESGSNMSMVHGVSSIQRMLREAVKSNPLKVIASEDSFEYVLSSIEQAAVSEKTKHCKFIVSSSSGGELPRSPQIKSRGNVRYEISYVHGRLPTFILSQNQVLILFYSLEDYRPKPLSPVRSRLSMLHALVVTDRIYIEEMHQLYKTLWAASRIK